MRCVELWLVGSTSGRFLSAGPAASASAPAHTHARLPLHSIRAVWMDQTDECDEMRWLTVAVDDISARR